MKHDFYADKTDGRKFFTVFDQRINLLKYLGIEPIKIGDFCHRLNYRQYIIDIIVSNDERDLHKNCNESWWTMRQIVEGFSTARLRGRDCYHTAKDICIDALFTDLIVYFMKDLYPSFDFRKNAQDTEFDLLSSVGLEPDFWVGKNRVEMKMSKTMADDSNRSNWTDKTFTLR